MDIINTKNTVNQILSSQKKKSERKDLTEIQIQQNINNFSYTVVGLTLSWWNLM